MAGINFEERLKESISSVLYEVKYVSGRISKAQQLYDSGDDYGAAEALRDAAALLREAGENWAAEKVEYYLRFM